MAELNEQAKELKRILESISPTLRRFGLDVYNSERKLSSIRQSSDYARMVRRNSLDSSIASLKSSLERYAQLADADRLMRLNPGKFSTSAQALSYNRRMLEISDPQYAARVARISRYGERGSIEIARAEKESLFARDTMESFDREKLSLAQRYNGDMDLAEKRLKMEALKNLPEFFKNSKMTAKELRQLGIALNRIPFFSRAQGAYNQFKEVGGFGSLGGKITALMAGVDLAKKVLSWYADRERDKRDVYNRSRIVSGVSGEQYFMADMMMKNLYGGTAENYLRASKSYDEGMGRLEVGVGDTGFLERLAPYLSTSDLTGSGVGGLPTSSEMRVRVAKRLKELGNKKSKYYNMGMARALLSAYGGDETFFNAAIDFGENADKYILKNKHLKDIAEMNMKGAEDAGKYLLGTDIAEKGLSGVGNSAIEAISNAGLWNKLIKVFKGMPMVNGGAISEIGIIDNVRRTEEAAHSVDVYERNRESESGNTKAIRGDRTQNISFNFSGTEIKASDPEGFIQETVALSSARIQMNKNVLSAFDLMEVA